MSERNESNKNPLKNIASALKSARRFARGGLHATSEHRIDGELESFIAIAVDNLEKARVRCHDLILEHNKGINK